MYDGRSKEHYKCKTISPGRKFLYWMVVFIFTIAIVVIRLVNENQFFTIKYLGTIIVSSISGIFIAITQASVIFYKKAVL